MSANEALHNRVYVILAKYLCLANANKHGQFKIQNESAQMFVSVSHGFRSHRLENVMTTDFQDESKIETFNATTIVSEKLSFQTCC